MSRIFFLLFEKKWVIRAMENEPFFWGWPKLIEELLMLCSTLYASVIKAPKIRPVVHRKKNDFIVRLVQLELRGTTTISSLLARQI